jgi:hypothetical protein
MLASSVRFFVIVPQDGDFVNIFVPLRDIYAQKERKEGCFVIFLLDKSRKISYNSIVKIKKRLRPTFADTKGN